MTKEKLLKSTSLSLLLLALVLAASPVLAAPPTSGIMKGVQCASPGETKGGIGPNPGVYIASKPCDLCDFIQVFVNTSNLIVSFSGALAILIFVYAGLMYLTISFKPENLAKAKSAIKATIIGLAFIFGGYTIINFTILTLIGGTSKMSALGNITHMGSTGWGVCEGYDAPTPAASPAP